MKKYKKLPKTNLLVTAIGIVVLLITIAILSFVVFNEKQRLDRLYNQEVTHSMEGSYRTTRITFCYDNKINPCSDDAITAWNNGHPVETLPLTPPTVINR